jgi:hypothetical protein
MLFFVDLCGSWIKNTTVFTIRGVVRGAWATKCNNGVPNLWMWGHTKIWNLGGGCARRAQRLPRVARWPKGQRRTERPPLKAVSGPEDRVGVLLEPIIRHGAVSTTHVEELALLRSGAHTARIGTVSRATALGLHGVVLEHEEIIRTKLKCRTI